MSALSPDRLPPSLTWTGLNGPGGRVRYKPWKWGIIGRNRWIKRREQAMETHSKGRVIQQLQPARAVLFYAVSLNGPPSKNNFL